MTKMIVVVGTERTARRVRAEREAKDKAIAEAAGNMIETKIVAAVRKVLPDLSSLQEEAIRKEWRRK